VALTQPPACFGFVSSLLAAVGVSALLAAFLSFTRNLFIINELRFYFFRFVFFNFAKRNDFTAFELRFFL
jgi:hypothetical protein